MIAFKEFMWSGDSPPNRDTQLAKRNASLQKQKLPAETLKPVGASKNDFKAGVVFGMRMRQSGQRPEDFPELQERSVMFRKGVLKGYRG